MLLVVVLHHEKPLNNDKILKRNYIKASEISNNECVLCQFYMNLNKTKCFTLFVNSSMMLSVTPLLAQKKKLISIEEYGKWEYLRGTAISKNGNWSSYQIDKVNKDKTTLNLKIHEENYNNLKSACSYWPL
ncbi:MAG: hypothetical protein ACJAYY_001290 [Paraglaciecola sp.]|jgi:hypothetical protein